MTSSILPPRSALAPCSPSTQAMASTTLLLPEPFGPTTDVMPGSKRRVVADAKDLKPRSVSDLRCTELLDQRMSARLGAVRAANDASRSDAATNLPCADADAERARRAGQASA